MKKLIITCFIIFSFSSAAMANIFLDVYGSFITAGDAEYQIGGGGAFGVDIVKEISFIFRGKYTTMSFNADEYNAKKYSLLMLLAGAEYTYSIPKAYMGWKSSIMIGMGQLDVYEKRAISFDEKGMGLSIGIWTGVKFDATQHVSPFIDVGFHYGMFFGELQKYKVYGVDIMIGIRFVLYGKNRNLYENY